MTQKQESTEIAEVGRASSTIPAEVMPKKRSKAQRERDFEVIAQMYLEGHSQREIAEFISAREGDDCKYTLSQQQISYDLKEIRKRWLTSALVDMDTIKAEELAKIDRLEREYWDAWYASLDPEEQERIEESGGEVKTVSAKKWTSGNAQFLQGIQWCINRRIEIFGLDAPKRTQAEVRETKLSVDLDLTDLSNDELAQLERVLRKALPGPGESGEGAAQPDSVHPDDVLEVPGRARPSSDS